MRSTLRWLLSVGLTVALLMVPMGLALAHGGVDDGDEPEEEPAPAASAPAAPAAPGTPPEPEATAAPAEAATPASPAPSAAPMAEHTGDTADPAPATPPTPTGTPADSAPAPAAPTQLALRLEPDGADQARAVAVLTDPSGQPLQNATITFLRKTTFGEVSLGTVRTNGAGLAAADLPVSPGQEVKVTAAFKGSRSWRATEAGASLSVPAVAATSRPPGLYTQRPNPWFLAILLVVVGGVWLTYAAVFYLLFGLSRARMAPHRVPVPSEIPATSD